MLFRNRGRRMYCPMCMHPGHITDKYVVDWSEEKKEFTVSLALYCWPCHYHWGAEAIASLPLDIARGGNCSCGGALSLGAYTVKRNGDEIEFRGKYFCETCRRQTTTIISQLASAIAGLWSGIGRVSSKQSVEVGPNGLSTAFDAGGVFISHASADSAGGGKRVRGTV